MAEGSDLLAASFDSRMLWEFGRGAKAELQLCRKGHGEAAGTVFQPQRCSEHLQTLSSWGGCNALLLAGCQLCSWGRGSHFALRGVQQGMGVSVQEPCDSDAADPLCSCSAAVPNTLL